MPETLNHFPTKKFSGDFIWDICQVIRWKWSQPLHHYAPTSTLRWL